MHSEFSALMLECLDSVAFASAFQPVYSLTHGRLVGHEALLRVERRADGVPVPPNVFFEGLRGLDERAAADLASFRQHLGTYAAQGRFERPEWLFLNLHPGSLGGRNGRVEPFAAAIAAGTAPPERLVIEVLESSLLDPDGLDRSVAALRELGCLIAIDDFGAGHSNFDRVFQLSPHIVKLDRHVLLRAKQSAQACRIVRRMVSLLHECGCLVLMEGIETIEGARIALGCDVDLVQGYFFARPHPRLRDGGEPCEVIDHAWSTFDGTLAREEDEWRIVMGEQCARLQAAALDVAAGAALATACAPFLASPGASMCYLLDYSGRQVGDVVFASEAGAGLLGGNRRFDPLNDCTGARWARRPYFRRAVGSMNAVQLTRPYLTLQGSRMCFTASIAFECSGSVVVLCGDIVVDGSSERL